MTTVAVTATDVQRLLNALHGDESVLYISIDSGAPEIDVWVDTYVHHARIITNRVDLIDWIGENPDADTIAECLPGLQDTVDQIIEDL